MIYTYGVEINERKHPFLVEERKIEYQKESMSSPKKIATMMDQVFHLSSKAEEYVYMIAFSSAMEILGIFQISHGTINSSMLSPRETMIRVLLCGAAGVAIVHNHPSGSLYPSKDDMLAFERLKKVFDLFHVSFYDFIIMGKGFYSFKKEDLF